jgi:hypothetical protein
MGSIRFVCPQVKCKQSTFPALITTTAANYYYYYYLKQIVLINKYKNK